MKEVKKADISLPEGDVNPIAPLPKHILSIMVSYSHKMFEYLLNIWHQTVLTEGWEMP